MDSTEFVTGDKRTVGADHRVIEEVADRQQFAQCRLAQSRFPCGNG
jgi:hypothetical protein